MARPLKIGLEYFSVDVDMDRDDKIQFLESEFPLKGFYVFMKLLMKIYRNGYYYPWTDREKALLSYQLPVTKDEVDKIVALAIDVDLFSRQLFETYGILTSRGIQKRYLEGTRKREEVPLIKQFLLLGQDYKFHEKCIFVPAPVRPPVSSGSLPPDSRQSAEKGKDRKGEERKVENRRGNSREKKKEEETEEEKEKEMPAHLASSCMALPDDPSFDSVE